MDTRSNKENKVDGYKIKMCLENKVDGYKIKMCLGKCKPTLRTRSVPVVDG
jgi:hypothetical protein